MLPERVLLYGKDEALPERTLLRAGPLTVVWEAGDLRTIRYGGREVVRRIYVATRDRNWGTVPNVISNLEMKVEERSFEITFDVANRQNEIDFTWRGRIQGTNEGVITCAFDGVANTTFLKNRIGFCILHPAESAGAACRIEHVDGAMEAALLPETIRPDQPLIPFAEMAALAHEVTAGVWAEVRFEGDIFEMEDQRNWTDASFKTFCTPLRLPYPAEMAAGSRVAQKLTLRVIDPHATDGAAAGVDDGVVAFGVIEGAALLPMPPIGLGAASQDVALNEVEIARLSALQPSHLRVELWLDDEEESAHRLQRAARDARVLGVGLEMAIYLGDECASELDTLVELSGRVMPPVSSWIVCAANEKFWGGTAIDHVVEEALPVLRSLAPDAAVGSGTNYDLIFLLRNPPPLDKVDFVSYAIQPQAHAFDTWSVSETAPCQAATVKTASDAAQGKPVHVSPVTLKMRRNPYATAAAAEPPPGELPPQVDVRQMSLFGAGWTLASLKALIEGGAAQITCYETVGWRGVMECASGSPLPNRFQSIAGGVYPLYHVIADVTEASGGQVIPSRSSNPLAVEGLVLRKGQVEVTLLANVTPIDQRVELAEAPGPLSLRVLEAATVEEAMTEPEAWRTAGDELLVGDLFTLHLPPFAVARLERVI